MEDFNPFPDYPVIRLKQVVSAQDLSTFSTKAVETARTVADSHAAQWKARAENPTATVSAVAVAVKGDYGTGKTHLLLDATTRIQDELSKLYPNFPIVKAACQETDVFHWFSSTIGPTFQGNVNADTGDPAPGFVERAMLRMYALAAQAVASRTHITTAAIAKLKDNPESVKELVSGGRLNVSLVAEEFDRHLAELCSEATPNVRRALLRTVWRDAAALRWLGGTTLSDEEARTLQLPKQLADQEEAFGVLSALAIAHKVIGIPFVFLVDELEHLSRYDTTHRNKNNLIWLKRVVEAMGRQSACVFVSGHFDGWPQASSADDDLLQRFKTVIELNKLTADEVQRLVAQRVSGSALSEPQAQAILSVTDGSMRRVLSLCQLLFRQSKGFTQSLSVEQIRQTAQGLRGRLAPEQVAVNARRLFEQAGFSTRGDAVTDNGVRFDVLVYDGDRLRAVMDVRHALYQVNLASAANEFYVRVEAVLAKTSDVVAFFLFDGNIDSALRQILERNRPFKSCWYDLSESDSFTRLTVDVRRLLEVSGPKADGARPTEVEQAALRSAERIKELEARLDAAGPQASSALVQQIREERELAASEMRRLTEELAARDAQLRESFFDQLRALENQRSSELAQLRATLSAQRPAEGARPSVEAESRRESELTDERRITQTFDELTQRLGIATMLRMALSKPAAQVTVLVALAIIVSLIFGLQDYIADRLVSPTYPEPTTANLHSITIVTRLLLAASFLALGLCFNFLWSMVSDVSVFLDYSARTLRQVRLGYNSVSALLRADHVLRESFETSGPLNWRVRADDQLRAEFGVIFGEKTH